MTFNALTSVRTYMNPIDSTVAVAEAHKFSLFCRSDEVILLQLMRVYVKYLEENPNLLHIDAGILLSLALKQAFPCE